MTACERPGCPSVPTLSGFCAAHYWEREAGRLQAILDRQPPRCTAHARRTVEGEPPCPWCEVERLSAKVDRFDSTLNNTNTLTLEQQARIAELETENARLARDHATMLETLTHCQTRCTALLDECRGWRQGSTFIEHGNAVRGDVMGAVVAERWRQDAKWGAAEMRVGIPDGTHEHGDVCDAIQARAVCDHAYAEGRGTLRHVLEEEVAEAFAESDPAKLRAELVQVAAVAVLWCEVIDLRGAK